NSLLRFDRREASGTVDGGVDVVAPEDVRLGALGAQRLAGVPRLRAQECATVALLDEVREVHAVHAPARSARRASTSALWALRHSTSVRSPSSRGMRASKPI